MTFGYQPDRKPADMTLEGWVTCQTDKALKCLERGDKVRASRILHNLSNDIMLDGGKFANPCGEMPLVYPGEG